MHSVCFETLKTKENKKKNKKKNKTKIRPRLLKPLLAAYEKQNNIEGALAVYREFQFDFKFIV